jgi:hypothetical protein
MDSGQDFMAADWDTLIILDACRYDVFTEFADDMPGVLEKAISKGSMTTEFLRKNLSNRDMTDTVYVTGNPQLYRLENGIYDAEAINVDFHAQVDVWRDEGWDNTYHTVRPEVITEAALKAAENYPDKRFIVHYMQPHAPYIGPTGEDLPTDHLDFWGQFRDGTFTLSLDVARKAYRENLGLVLSDVKSLLSEIEGKTVVTADHGESLGDRDWPIPIRRYGHTFNSQRKELVEVPWLVFTRGDRRDIVAEKSKENPEPDDIDDGVVKKRLEDLGYRE